MGTVVALAGQVGGARLAEGLYRLRGKSLAVIVNTGDDHEHLRLAFSPDLDTMLYTLAGIASASAGWEVEGEMRSVQSMLRMLGGGDRRQLGDKSLAAPLLRTDGLAADRRLTEITLGFCRSLGITARILPMSDDPVRTYVQTEHGEVSFHEYFYQLGCEPRVSGFNYAGADTARLSDEVLEALHATDLEAIVICPANPYHSIRPILAVNGMRELLRRRRDVPVIAVTPIVGGKALRGSAGKMMRELGREPSARGAAVEYLKLIDGFVLDREDLALSESIRSLGMDVLTTQTVMRNGDDRLSLARAVLEFARKLREAKALQR